MNNEKTLIDWISLDAERTHALKLAAELGLNDWCIAAGFVRNLVWDKLHAQEKSSSLNDIDLIYFDRSQNSKENDKDLEDLLLSRSSLPWSVKNQARMHTRNGDQAYANTEDAMKYWTEIETAVGVKLNAQGAPEIVAPFGLDALFAGTITINPHRIKIEDFEQRVHSKCWLEHWPKLTVEYA